GLIPSVSRPLRWPLAETGSVTAMTSEVSQSRPRFQRGPRMRLSSTIRPPVTLYLPASAVTAPASDTRALSCPRSRPLPFGGSLSAHAVAAIHVFPLLALKPPRSHSRPHLSHFADCRAESGSDNPFPPPFLAGTAGWRHLLRPGGAALLCFPASRDPPDF